MSEDKPIPFSAWIMLAFVAGIFIGGLFNTSEAVGLSFNSPAPNLCPMQLKTCEGRLENLTRWDIADKGVLETLVATHQNKSYSCLNWTEIPYRIGGSR